MKKSLPFPLSFIFTFCFFLPALSSLKAMQPSVQVPQNASSLSTKETSELERLLKLYRIPVTPNTLQALAKYPTSLERHKLANSLSHLIAEGYLDPLPTTDDIDTVKSFLASELSVPSNFKEVREKLKTFFPTQNVTPETITVVSGILDPSVKKTQNTFSQYFREAYETENRLLRTLTDKDLTLKKKLSLYRKGLFSKEIYQAPSSFSSNLFELQSDPVRTLKRLYYLRQELLKDEAQVDIMDPTSLEAQELQKSITDQKAYLALFSKNTLDRASTLMDQRASLILPSPRYPIPSFDQEMDKIDEQIFDLAHEKSLRDSYVQNVLNFYPPGSRERVELKDTFLKTPSLEEFSGAKIAHHQGVRGRGSSILIIEFLEDLEPLGVAPFKKFGINNSHFHPTSLKHALAVENIARHVAPHADIFLTSHKIVGTAPSVQEIRDTLQHYELGPQFGNPLKIINLSLESNDLSSTLSTLYSSGNHLFVFAAGNDGKRMEENPLFDPDFYDPSALDSVRDNIIFAGSLTRHFGRAPSSNFPDFFQRDPADPYYFQNRFLFTLGSDVPVRDFYPTYAPQSGTSLAAPVISGAAALLQSAYPSFSMSDIQTILLESAEQNFFMQTSLPEDPEASYTYSKKQIN